MKESQDEEERKEREKDSKEGDEVKEDDEDDEDSDEDNAIPDVEVRKMHLWILFGYPLWIISSIYCSPTLS